MNPLRRPRTVHGFRPLAILLVAAVSGVISAPLRFARGSVCRRISINDVTITEGNTGTLTVTFTVTQSARGKTSVRYATARGHGLESGRLPGEDRDAEVRRRA